MAGSALKIHTRLAVFRPATIRIAIVTIAMVGTVLAACSAPPASRPPSTTGRPPPPPSTVMVTTTTIPGELVPLIEAIAMTDLGRRTFLAASPRIEGPTLFAENCDATTPVKDGAHTHGCFVGGTIHLRAIGAAEVADLIDVVAAHELLHAVYAGLSVDEKATIDGALNAVRDRTPRLRERLKAYSTGDDLAAELHSVAGTEFSDLPAALEAHYSQYFDRAKVVAAYARALGDRDRAIRGLRSKVTALDEQVDAMRRQLDDLESKGDIDAFNAAVEPFNRLVAERNESARTLNARVQEYNRLIAA